MARGAANRGRKGLSVFRVLGNGDGRGGNEIDVLPALVRLLVCGGSRVG